MTVLKPAASIWAVATRICQLDAEGYPDPGNAMYVTEQLLKLTPNPVIETGDDIAIKNATGDLSPAFGKHPDMLKYGTLTVDLAVPDPALEALCTGGTLLGSAAAALGEVTGAKSTAFTTLGELLSGPASYRISQYNSFGESLAVASVVKTLTGPTASAAIYAKPSASALGLRVYGRSQGIEQLLGTIPNIGEQETNAAIPKGTPTSITVTALTESIPKGTKFMIESNATVVFTATAFCPKGVVSIPVEASGEVAVEIATKKKLEAVFQDTGAVTPLGNLPQEDQTGGPGENTGMNTSELGPVGNPNGVSIEVFAKAIEKNRQATKQPFIHWVFPRVVGMHIMTRDLTNANTATMMEGIAEENPNWGKGPVGDWPFASAASWYGRARCGRAVVPAASYEKQAATL